ncbi:MAG TPA: FadR/GntR family transcriptional regulator, partial [Gaiellaceae bacterium]|nr:FadR/GntR family transcriptional regulator [Gaiellaceae bacterium]
MGRERTVSETPLQVMHLSRRAHEFVAHELLVLVLSGRFRPGDRLPPERQLATTFGVSRPTVRQALGVLAAHGLVETRVGSGTFVVGPAPPETELAGDVPGLRDVLEARLVFEVGTARLAARRVQRGAEDLELVRAIVEALERSPDRDRFPIEIDVAFHRSIAQLTGNQQLVSLVAPCWQAMATATAAASTRSRWTREDTARAASQHRAVFEAVRVGDAELAGFAMERHLRAELGRLADDGPLDGPPA